jgi:hypothetical protein
MKTMQINFKNLMFAVVLLTCCAAWAQTDFPKLKALKPIVDAKTGFVLPDVGLHEKGDNGLVLPDGSVIATVWPATLQISNYQIPSTPPLPKRPIEQICEPAVYSLARYTPEGKELWAKSYIFKGRVEQACFAYYLGFDVFSAMQEVREPGYYAMPFNGRIVIGSYIDADPNKFEVDVETGEAVQLVPKNLRVIDAYELRRIKEKIALELNRLFPEPELPIKGSSQLWKEFGRIRSSHERSRHQLFYKQLEAALF